jgi:hypothetical protein
MIDLCISVRASFAKEQRMKQAIAELQKQGEYPSAAKISHAMGRRTSTLNGPECVTRRQIFRELGIYHPKIKLRPLYLNPNSQFANE